MRKVYPILLCGGLVSLYGATGIIMKDVTIREAPSNKAKEVADIYKNQTIEIIKKVDGGRYGTWYKTQKGYIYEKFVKVEDVPTLPKLVENSGTDMVHPYGNPMYVDASKLENKPTLFTDEKGQVYTKSSLDAKPVEPQSQITPLEVIPVVANPIIAPVIVPSPIVVAKEQPKEEIKEQVVLIDTNTTATKEVVPIVVTPIENNATNVVQEEQPKIIQEDTNNSKEIVTVEQKEVVVSPKNKYFVGLGFNLNSFSVDKTNQVGNIVLNKPLDEKATSFLFQVGTTLSQNYILSGNYEIVNLNDVNIDSYFLSLDYRFEYEKLSPYLGISLGMSDLKWQYDPLVNSQLKDTKLSSLLYGVQGGFVYPLENNWSLFSQLAYQKLNFKTNLTSTPAKSTITHDDKKSLGIGFRYSF